MSLIFMVTSIDEHKKSERSVIFIMMSDEFLLTFL
jgi:hypothetical protein